MKGKGGEGIRKESRERGGRRTKKRGREMERREEKGELGERREGGEQGRKTLPPSASGRQNGNFRKGEGKLKFLLYFSRILFP